MNHTVLKDLPHIKNQYNRSRYIDRLYRCTSLKEIHFVLCHGIYSGCLDASDIIHIYVNADCRILDEDIQVADWVMTELDPIVAYPGPVSLSVVLDSFLLE